MVSERKMERENGNGKEKVKGQLKCLMNGEFHM